MHNAGVSAMPSDSDWQYISTLTGDQTWSSLRMREYLMMIEDAAYSPGDRLHGHGGYLTLTQAQVNLTNGSDGKTMVEAMAAELGLSGVSAEELVKRDMNGVPQRRDEQTGIYGQIRHADSNGRRVGTNSYIKATLEDPAKYPLTVQLNSLVSKVLFANETRGMGTTPKAIGVEYLYGKSLYSADPRSNMENNGELRQVFATREVIISAGVFNTPQLLKLSGIGPKEELDKFGIPVVVDSPGVGTRLADNYETSLISLASRDLGPVGGTTAVMLKSSITKRERDLYLFCGAFSFEGYWPGFPTDHGKSQYECAVVHMGPRSQAGTVTLRSTDPRDTPDINFRFFETGEEEDLTSILDGVKWARKAFSRATGLAPWTELHPCKAPKVNCTDAEQKEWIKNNAYSHHATSTAQIGADGDKMAVLDSKFKVRGVKGLRVVDASVFPKVPGAFPVIPTFILSEKATETILEELGEVSWRRQKLMERLNK
jgi:choline dehydrogenase